MFKRNKTMHRTSLNLFRQKSPDPDHLSKMSFFLRQGGGESAKTFIICRQRGRRLCSEQHLRLLFQNAGSDFAAKLIFISVVPLPETIDANINRLPLDIDGFFEVWTATLRSLFPPSSLVKLFKYRYVKCAGSKLPFPSFHLLCAALSKVLLSETAGQKLLDSLYLLPRRIS